MGNKIRIKQIDLQGIISASGQVSLLSASNYVSFVTQLDTTMSSDVELAAVSSSISQSIYTINRTLGSGLISGSSQLTSSYDTRYVLSGSITQTTWDNISGKPSGLVSQSTDLTPLTSKTGSYATTGSNVFIGNQIITGSVSILIPGGTAYAINENPSSNNEFWAYIVDYPAAQNVAVGWTATIVGGGTYTVTAVNYQHPFNKITLSDGSLTMGYRIGINFSKSSKLWEFNSNGTLIGLPVGLISGSSQLTSSFDGRYTLTSSFNSFTASYFTDSASVDTRITTEKGRIDAILSASSADKDSFAEIVTLINSVDTTNDNAFASFYTSSNSRISSLENATSSYETKGSGIISGSSQLSGTTIPNLSGSFTGSFRGNVTGLASQASLVLTQNSNLNQDYSLIFAASGSNGYMQTYTDGVPGVLYNPSTNRLKSAYLQGEIEATNGVISGSSQLTSSFDTRYTLSGSVQPLPSGIISGSSQLTSSYDTRYTLSGSVQPLPAGLISGSSQLTSSFATTGSNSFSGSQTITGSLIVSAIAVVSGGINVPTGSVLSLTSGSSISIDSSGAITGSLTGSVFGIGNVVAFSSSVDSRLLNLQLASASLNAYTTSNDSWKDGVTNDISAINGVLSSLNNTYATDVEVAAGYEAKGRGIISGSSQLTSSYDTRYTLSGSISAVPSGTISGSSQLTASFDIRYAASGSGGSLPSGVISGSSQLTSSYDNRYSLSGSILTSFSSSVDNRLDTLEASIITGSINYTQVLGNRRTGITSVGTSIISGSITTTGNPVQIMMTGDANPIGGAGWCRLQIFRDGNGIGNIIQVENSSNLNVPYCLNVIDTPSAGTYTYSMRTVDSMSGTFDFGEFNGPVLTAVELKSNTQLPSGIISGSSQLPSGLISGSSQLTASYDTRYTLSGSVQPLPSGLLSSSAQLPSGLISGSSQLTASYDTRYTLSGSVVSGTTPAGTISGSSQLTSSFDGRYLVTGSVTSSILQLNTFTASNANTSLNTFTSSLNIWSSSLATTGSNSFNGTQTITGSLIITTGSFLASQILANTSSLYLTSGSNLYVQNNGLTEITGSLRLSGSLAMSGSISISSGSITMPNRPAFRVYGLGGATTAITTLSGSMTIVDYNQGGWDNTTGTFTAPIAGLYQVNLVCRTNSNNSAQSVQVIVYKNNTTTSPSPNGTAQVMVEWAANTNVNHIGASTISKLAVGDTLKAIVTVGTASFDVNDNFSVAYIG